MDSYMDVDLYELIGVSKTASTQEIKKAYRRKALSCHPDKNQNNPQAAELFHGLSRALEILTDTSARVAYDKVINAKYQAELRAKEFDSKRRKFKEDLEAREYAYNSSNEDYHIRKDKNKLQAEIERLQKEGSKQLEEEIALMKEHVQKQPRVSYVESEGNESYRVKLKWTCDKNHANNGGYDYDTLHRILSKYGDITALVISSARNGRALVEYKRKTDAEMAVSTEIGLAHCPLLLQKLWKENKEEGVAFPQGNVYNVNNLMKEHVADSEFEHSVLNNLRKAEERKRLFVQSNLKKNI